MIMPHREVANCVRQAPARRKSALKSSTQEREEPVSTVQAVGSTSRCFSCVWRRWACPATPSTSTTCCPCWDHLRRRHATTRYLITACIEPVG
ncbi:hypothetical protein MRX96_043691 [Rhipicephalus microplus]